MKRILVPIDFSPAMESILAHAREQARAFGAELHLVHVREIAALPGLSPANLGYPGIGVPEMGMGAGLPAGAPVSLPIELPNEQRTNQLEALKTQLSQPGLKVSVDEREGPVVEEILAAAQDVAADFIVMGSHGHSAVYNLLVGSVTEGVLKAGRTPLLLVPTLASGK